MATDADLGPRRAHRAALEEPDTSFTVCRNGRQVSGRDRQRHPDIAILDLQIGSMGGMAVTMALRLDESAGDLLPRVPVLMLLDRAADLHLAKRSDADGWLIKPLDARRLARAAPRSTAGGHVREGAGPAGGRPGDRGSRLRRPAGETVTSG